LSLILRKMLILLGNALRMMAFFVPVPLLDHPQLVTKIANAGCCSLVVRRPVNVRINVLTNRSSIGL
jgi:hypothetical protein